MQWLWKWWRRRQRAMDMRILWPVLKEQAPDLHIARAAFYMHASNDCAWTDDYSVEDLIEFTEQMT